MIIEKELWEKIDGFDERLIRNEDLDFGFRLSKIGFPALLDNHLFAFHHTIEYSDKSRALDFYFSKALLSSGVLMRKHLFDKAYLKRHYRDVFFVFYLLLSVIFLFINQFFGLILLALYILMQIIRSIKKIKKEKNISHIMLFIIIYNFYSLTGFMFYFPNQPKYAVTK